MKNKKQRINRVIARGETSNHCHVIVGDEVTIRREENGVFIDVPEAGAVLRHLLEKEFVETGKEVWTKEHKDIPLKKGTYKYVQQIEYDPYNEVIVKVTD